LNEKIQTKVFDHLELNGITDFLGVPDSTMKYFIKQGLKKGKILISTREEEALGIATGISLSKGLPLVFMQNAGFANSLSTITSLIQLYEIPMILLIGWRGYLKNDAPEHKKIGQIQPKLINMLGIKSKILYEKSWKGTCNWAIKELKNKKLVCLIIKRDFID